jgi:Asp-tRNA(Asn)/Glu-tRNA(Gln) amidotransferase A subunit family amidase
MSEETVPPTLPEITPELIDAFDTLSGRRPTTNEQRQLMLESLMKLREQMTTIRLHPQATGESAIRFTLGGAPHLIKEMTPEIRPALSRTLPDAPPENLEELAFTPVTVLSQWIRSRRISSVALTKMYLERLKRLGPGLHCLVTLTEERALMEAARADSELESGIYHGYLHGIPYGVKDNYAALGYATTVGAEPYREQYIPYDAAAVERLTAAGAVLCAKLSMGELAMGDTWFGGLTRNPWDIEKGSSGSSAGSGSSVAAGLLPFALGTETLGSIISPSKVCGTVGLRPTFGRISRYGIVPLTPSMDKPGPICRSVEDAALIFSVLNGPDSRDSVTLPGAPFHWDPHRDLSDLRIGIDETSFRLLRESDEHKELISVYDQAMEVIGSLSGVRTLVPVTLPERHPAFDSLAWLTIIAEGAATFARLYDAGGFDRLAQQGKENWPNLLRIGAMIPAADYLQAQQLRAHLQRQMAIALTDVDVYITAPWFGRSLAYTNLCGQPEVITRCGRTEGGLPVSLSFVGNLYGEEAILRVAQAFDQATEWNRIWPHGHKGTGGGEIV